MKTVRFSKIVEKCGKPETHLVLTAPAKDRVLQAAVKAHRVMTVGQESVGTKTDRGEVGFHAGTGRQFLVFPKSLRAFANRVVVGIKYDLVNSASVPKSDRAKRPAPANKAKRNSAKKQRSASPPTPARENVVAFRNTAEESEDDGEIADLKRKVRHAMSVLEEGKAVAAFNLLKRIVGD